MPPLRISSIFGFNSSSETSVTSSARSIFHSPASLLQAICLERMGISTESTPSRLTPRRINGNTLTLRSGDMALPHAATRPLYFAALSAVARILPPTVSTTPAQRGFCSGLPDVSFASSREIIVLAPSPIRKACSFAFPVAATTLKPSLPRIATATLPTPPVAPVTNTSPESLDNPLAIKRITHNAAVSPAVP